MTRGGIDPIPCALELGKRKDDRWSAYCFFRTLFISFPKNIYIYLALPFFGLLHQVPGKYCVSELSNEGGEARPPTGTHSRFHVSRISDVGKSEGRERRLPGSARCSADPGTGGRWLRGPGGAGEAAENLITAALPQRAAWVALGRLGRGPPATSN